jgi:gliding motility-associated-like protein
MYYTLFGADIYLGGRSFGNNVKTAFFIASNPHQPNRDFTWLGIHLWATEKGMFQTQWDHSYISGFNPIQYYLKGVDIRKISSVYGLLNFGTPEYRMLIKENVLVGTAQGLYFSDSQLSKAPNIHYTFFHYDGLGNKLINDICVNANSYDRTYYGSFLATTTGAICEDGIWVAAEDGLYFITQDYGPYIDPNQKVQALVFHGHDFTTSELQSCANSPIDILFVYGETNGALIKWFKDGVEIPNENGKKLTTNQPGDYNAIMYDPCSSIHLETNHLKITTIAAPVFTFNYPDKLYYCNGSAATLQTENNPNYQYRWYKDGTLNGIKTASLNVTDAGKYKLEVSGCSANWVSTKEVEVNFIKLPQPSVSADKSAYCIGDQSTLTVNTPLSDTYDINWYLNGTPINADQNKTSIVTDQPGSYTVNVSSKLASCIQSSASYNLSFEPPPTLSLQKIINTTFCDGQSVSLKATYSGGTIKWSTGETVDQINTKQTGIYTAMVSTAAGCTVSKDISVQFFPNPVLNIPDASLCQFTHQTITLTAPTGFAKYEWNGQAGTSTYVTGTLGKVTLKVTDNNGCTALQTINISIHCDDIHIPNTFTPNGDGINDKWEIAGLQGDESTIVKVYNRYGDLLFKNVGYSIPWDGTYKDKKLPAGVYYYVINTRGSNQVISGSVSIIY